MRSIGILIRHDHDCSIPQTFYIIVLFVDCQAQNFQDVLDLFVLHECFVFCFTNIQKFTLERKDSIVISSNYLETSHC